MAGTKEFEEWTGGASESEIVKIEKIVKKRFSIFLVLGIIPLLNFIFMGFAIYCYNNLSYIRSRGRTIGNDGLRFLMMIWGLIIIPIIEVMLCSKIEKLGTLIRGV